MRVAEPEHEPDRPRAGEARVRIRIQMMAAIQRSLSASGCLRVSAAGPCRHHVEILTLSFACREIQGKGIALGSGWEGDGLAGLGDVISMAAFEVEDDGQEGGTV